MCSLSFPSLVHHLLALHFQKKLTSLNETLEVLKKEAKVNEEILEKSRRQFDEVVTERNRYMKRNEVLSRGTG
jgi:Ser-tRNA(Ala) deacylase AlaX